MILLALVLAHIGRVRSRRIRNDAAQHRTALLFYSLSFLLVALVFLMR